MNLSNLPVLPEYVVTSSPYMDKSISFRAALDSYPDITEAIVCANDDSAFRISSLLMERGLKIPDDVAITGFDNDEFDAFSPFFTTVDCNALRFSAVHTRKKNRFSMIYDGSSFSIASIIPIIYPVANRFPLIP